MKFSKVWSETRTMVRGALGHDAYHDAWHEVWSGVSDEVLNEMSAVIILKTEVETDIFKGLP